MSDCTHENESVTVVKIEPVSGSEADLAIECDGCNATIVKRYDLTDVITEAVFEPDPDEVGWTKP